MNPNNNSWREDCRPTPGGPPLSEYLFGSRPHTIEDALKIAKDKEAQK